MPLKNIDRKDENSTCSDEELLDFLQEALFDAPFQEKLSPFSEDEVNPPMLWHDNYPSHMASSSSAKTINDLEKTDKDYTIEAYEPKSKLYDTANKASIKKNNKVSEDFKKFIIDEFVNNQQIYHEHPPIAKSNRSLSTHEGYKGFKFKSGVYSVFLPNNLYKGYFARFDEAITAAVASDFIVKAFDLDDSLLNFPTELYTREKILACRDILEPMIEKHKAIKPQPKINNDTESSMRFPALTGIQYQKTIVAFKQFINAFKEKNSSYFTEEALLKLDRRFYTLPYIGVHPAPIKRFEVSVIVNNRKLYVAPFTVKIDAVIAYNLVLKVLNLDKEPDKKPHLHPDLYTEEEIKACGKIILPLLEDKIKLSNYKALLEAKAKVKTKTKALSSDAAAAAAPKSTTSHANAQQIDECLESTEYLTRLTYAYDNSESAGSKYNASETATDCKQVSRKNKRARINQ